MLTCPCGSGKAVTACCDLYINQGQSAPTAEALMRSRYTAYTLANIDYIARTMKGPAAVDFQPQEAENFARSVTWNKLEVLNSTPGLTQAFVEFRAHYTFRNHPEVIHEKSEFHFEDGAWYYTDRSQY